MRILKFHAILKTYLPPERLPQVPGFDFKPLDDAFARLTSNAWKYEDALFNFKGSLSAEKKSEINALLKGVDQVFINIEVYREEIGSRT